MSRRHGHDQLDGQGSEAEALEVLAQTAHHSLLPTILAGTLDCGAPIRFANPAFAALTGLDAASLPGRPLTAALAGRADLQDLARLEAAMQRESGAFCRIALARESGEMRAVVAYLTPLHDAAGGAIGRAVTFVDPDSLLCMSHARDSVYAGIYDKAPGFIAIARGPEHRFEYTNASYRAFVKRDNLIGRTVAEALPEVAEDGLIAILDEVYRTGIPFRAADLPIRIRDRATGDLEQCWIDVLYQPVRDESGAVCGLFCEGYDVTERHAMNEAIAAMEMRMIHSSRVNAMGTMAAALAHELNQPLTAIANYLAGVRPVGGKSPDSARLLEAIDGIRQSAERAAGIIDHLRQLTRHRKPCREPFDLREAVAECVRLVAIYCSRETAFDNRVAANTVMAADRVKIQQVLINLLQNACEAMETMPPERRAMVSIGAFADRRGLTVCIADTGPGVPPEARETMFSWTETAKDEGMGIGLSICRTIVELYGGSIWLEASGPGGAEFRFRVPWADPAPNPAPPAAG